MAEFDPLVRAPDASAFSPSAIALGKSIGSLPEVFQQAQLDRFKLDAMNALKGISLVGPDGQINPAAYGQLAQALMATNPASALEALKLGQGEQDVSGAAGLA